MTAMIAPIVAGKRWAGRSGVFASATSRRRLMVSMIAIAVSPTLTFVYDAEAMLPGGLARPPRKRGRNAGVRAA